LLVRFFFYFTGSPFFRRSWICATGCTAIIISADADLLPPLQAIKQYFPGKKLVIAFPPRRDNPRLAKIADVTFRIGRGRLSKCQLPSSIKKPDGYVLTKPKEWV